MTQKTIKALYKQPVNYKLTKDGYKTINGVIQAQDGMPKVVDLPVPSELYTTDLQYNVNTEVNGAPVITTSEFTLPDNEICEAKEYCYAPKGLNYNYIIKQQVETKYLDTTQYTSIGTPTIVNGIISNFSSANYLQLNEIFNPGNNTWEIVSKIYTKSSVEQGIFGNVSGAMYKTFGISIYASPLNFAISLTSNGSSWDIANTRGTHTVALNKWYWIKLKFTGSTYEFYYSEDGINWVLDINIQSSASLLNSNTNNVLGYNNYGSPYPFIGNIDLFETYIKIANEYWFKPWKIETTIEEITTQIPGILDSSVTTDDWQQNQEYKLYQLKNQNNTDSLQLTENSITDTSQKYKQYINQLTIPARDYKWYYFDQHNYTLIGDINYNKKTGIINNFSQDNYIHIQDILPEFNTFEMQIVFDYSRLPSTNATRLIGKNSQDIQCGLVLGINSDNGLTLWTSSNGNEWTASTSSSYGVSINTKTYLKIIFENSTYTVLVSTDKINWTTYISLNDNKFIQSQPFDIGSYLNNYLLGNIYINECYIKLDGALWWDPFYLNEWLTNKSYYTYNVNTDCSDTLNFSESYIGVTQNQYHKYINPKVCLMPIDGGETKTVYSLNATEIGNTNFDIYTGISNRFSSTDYLQLPEAFNPGNNPWEMIIKIRTASDLQAWQEIFHSSVAPNNSGRYGISVIVDSGNFELDISTDGSSWIGTDHGTFVLSENTNYWVKVGWNSNEYYLEYSTNGADYIRDITYTVSNNLPNLTNSWIGIYRVSDYVYPILGSIDLSESYIKINDEVWWNGTSIAGIQNNMYKIKEVVQTNYDDLSKLPSTLIDGHNFELNGNTFRNGSASYQVASYGYSYGYFTYTPSKTQTISIKASVSSESGCDYGACYIGTRQYKASFDAVRNGNTDGYGSWLFSISGEVSTTTYTYTLQEGVTYYIEFYYAKDQSANTGNDRFIVSELSGFVSEAEKVTFLSGCLYNYNDDGSEHQFDVYYDSNYTQPILVSAGESYSEGTKVDTITIPAHKTWNYQADGNWSPIS